jgi:hypothetical protein
MLKLLRAKNRRSESLKIHEYLSLILPSFLSLATFQDENFTYFICGVSRVCRRFSLRGFLDAKARTGDRLAD